MHYAAPEQVIEAGRVYYSSLPLWAVVIPMLTGVGLLFLRDSWERLRKGISLAACLFSLASVLILFPLVFTGRVCYDLVNFMQLGLFLKLDLIGWVFAFLVTLVWVLAVIFSFAYMDHEHNRRRFYSFLVFTLGATLGVVLAGDFFTLFLFFELMTLSSFVLVIHEQDRKAMQAGMLYIYLGIAGGLSLLLAILMLYSSTGSVDMVPVLDQLGGSRTLIYVCFLIGFGIKAGLVPLHIWLPLAHPVAPSPASALLSGIMIKTGAYGILRVSLILFSTPGEPGTAAVSYLFTVGNVLMWFGIVTMLSGAVMALLQNNMKRILAYSSVSQIGYIATGLGVATFMGVEGAMGFTGAVYHIINHAFFKAGLFMMVGTVYIYTHELELSRLGGMFRKMPLVGVTFLVAAFGIAGIPGFNGYPSKTLVHDALLIAIKFYDLPSINLAEKIFVLTSALTICYFIKLFRGVFLGPVPEKIDKTYNLPLSVNLVLAAFALIIVAIGLFPNLILERVLVPAAEMLKYEGYGMDHLYHFHFFEWLPLQAMLVVAVLAAIIYLPGSYRNWFNWRPPPLLSITALIYRPATRTLFNLTCRGGSALDSSVDKAYLSSGKAARRLCSYVTDVDSGLDEFYSKTGMTGRKIAERSARVDSGIDRFYEKSGEAARRLADRTSDLDSALDDAYEKTGKRVGKLADKTSDVDRALNIMYDQAGKKTREEVEKRFKESKEKKGRFDQKKWNIKNLSFDNLLLILVLGVVLLVIFYFGRSW